MRIREVFVAGVPKQFHVRGNFLRVQEATAAVTGSVDVKFWRAGQLLPIDLLAADPGDWARVVPEAFELVEVLSTQNQTIGLQVLRGDVGSDRLTGAVSLAGIVTTSGRLPVMEMGSADFGTSTLSTTPLLANTPQNAFLAASNTAGARVLEAHMWGTIASASGIVGALIASLGTPATIGDGENVMQSPWRLTTSTPTSFHSGELLRIKTFASGRRLDHITNSAEALGMRSCKYTLY